MSRLTDRQLRDLFTITRFPARAEALADADDEMTGEVGQWVAAFKDKVTCRSGGDRAQRLRRYGDARRPRTAPGSGRVAGHRQHGHGARREARRSRCHPRRRGRRSVDARGHRRALERLSLAAALASALALRPRRLGTPQRRPAVIHTQIILSVVGALVMLVVGSSLARVRHRGGRRPGALPRQDRRPKDAGVMLSTLAVGLATGVGLWPIAIMGAAFLLLLLWVVESFEPTATRSLAVTIRAKEAAVLKRRIEAHLRRQGCGTVELRGVAPEEIIYEVHWPMDLPTDRLSEHLAALDASGGVQVVVEPTKEKS